MIIGRTLLEVSLCRMHHLEGNKLESASFETSDDLPDETTLDAVRLWWMYA